METTREEILALNEASVDSTTPEKVPPQTTKSVKKAKTAAAKTRAKDILGAGYDDSSDDDQEVEGLRKKVLMLEESLKRKEKTSSK